MQTQETYGHLSQYAHFRFFERERKMHPQLLTHAQVAAHIKVEHDEEYRAAMRAREPDVDNEALAANREAPQSFEEALAAAADNPLVKACERAAAESRG